MTDHAEIRNPVEAAAEAVKTYIRLHRETLASDGEMLALLVPERFAGNSVGDLQRHIIERLREQNAALAAECDSLKGARERASKLGEAVKARVLELLDARSFQDAIAVAVNAAGAFGADRAALCVEGDGAAPKNCAGALPTRFSPKVEARTSKSSTIPTCSGSGTRIFARQRSRCRR